MRELDLPATEEEWRQRLSPKQNAVLRQAGMSVPSPVNMLKPKTMVSITHGVVGFERRHGGVMCEERDR